MPERTSYREGTPNWMDLQTTDQQAAKAFYAGLFGWTYNDQPMPEGQVYSMAMIGGGMVAAIAPQAPQQAAAGQPATWNTYIAVDSVDDAVAKVEAAGGQVAMQPVDIPGAGRMAFVLDSGGAPVALWQAGQHIGATRVNEPGAVIWNELITTDAAAPAFYQQVAGMSTTMMDSEMGKYTMFVVDDYPVGGTTPPQQPGGPNHWHVYFAVADADATLAKVTELGGSVLAEAMDTPAGRMAAVRDPQGAEFSIIQPPAG